MSESASTPRRDEEVLDDGCLHNNESLAEYYERKRQRSDAALEDVQALAASHPSEVGELERLYEQRTIAALERSTARVNQTQSMIDQKEAELVRKLEEAGLAAKVPARLRLDASTGGARIVAFLSSAGNTFVDPRFPYGSQAPIHPPGPKPHEQPLRHNREALIAAAEEAAKAKR
jgi:hypothetical protein